MVETKDHFNSSVEHVISFLFAFWFWDNIIISRNLASFVSTKKGFCRNNNILFTKTKVVWYHKVYFWQSYPIKKMIPSSTNHCIYKQRYIRGQYVAWIYKNVSPAHTQFNCSICLPAKM